MAIINGGQFSFRPSPGLVEAVNEFIELHQEQSGVTLKTDKEIFEAIIDVAQSKYAPYVDNSKEAKELKKDNDTLTQTIDNLIKENKEVTELLKQYQTELSDKKTKVSNLQNIKDDILIRKSDINPVSMRLADRYLQTNKVVKEFEDANKNGLYDNFFDKINTDNKDVNLRNLILTSFLNSAMGKPLPAVAKNRKITATINKSIQKVDL